VLTEVILIASRSEALSGQGLFRNWRRKLAAAGFDPDEIVDGSTATLWSYCYGHNSGVPLCAHHGHYVAVVPPELRGRLTANSADSAGDLVAAKLQRTPDGAVIGVVTAIYRPATDWRPCSNAHLQREVSFVTMMSVGPPRANWIECDETVVRDWQRRPVPGAPPSTHAPVSQWFRSVPNR